jgi:hypothetical protein
MYDVERVKQLSGLSREQIIFIMKHYAELKELSRKMKEK